MGSGVGAGVGAGVAAGVAEGVGAGVAVGSGVAMGVAVGALVCCETAASLASALSDVAADNSVNSADSGFCVCAQAVNKDSIASITIHFFILKTPCGGAISDPVASSFFHLKTFYLSCPRCRLSERHG